MYKVTINGIEKTIEAKGITVESGTLVFFINKECTQSHFIVPAGKWDALEVLEGSNALQISKAKKVPNGEEAGSSEALSGAHQEEEKREAERKRQAQSQEG